MLKQTNPSCNSSKIFVAETFGTNFTGHDSPVQIWQTNNFGNILK